MENINIFIATHNLGTGGCETYILTMCKQLCEAGNKVIIGASDGILRTKFEEIGVKWYDINFLDRNQAFENIEKIENILKKEKIDIVHIHPFFTIFEAVIASIRCDVPYYLFFHGVSHEGYFDIKQIYSALGEWSNLYISKIAYPNAEKYIFVSNEVKDFYNKIEDIDTKKRIHSKKLCKN